MSVKVKVEVEVDADIEVEVEVKAGIFTTHGQSGFEMALKRLVY